MFLSWSIISKKSFPWRCQLHLMQRFEMLLFRSKIRQPRHFDRGWTCLLARPSPASAQQAGKIQIPSAEGMNRLFQSARAAEANIPGESCSTGTFGCHAESQQLMLPTARGSGYSQPMSTSRRAAQVPGQWLLAGRTQTRKKVSSSFYPVQGHRAAHCLTHNLCMGEYTHISNTYLCSLTIPQYVFHRNNANMF